MKKIFKIILLVLLTISISSLAYNTARADSGFDVSYSSGGSSSSHSSYSSSGGSYSYETTWVEFFLALAVAIFFLVLYFDHLKKLKEQRKPIINNQEYLDEHKKELEQEIFNIYKETQMAWMNFDYNKLESLLTDELYNMYCEQLKILKLKREKNIMSDIEMHDINIFHYVEDNDMTTMKAILTVSMYDYITDQANIVVRGSDKFKVKVTYELEFIKYTNGSDYCPNCGAKLANNNSKCEYCNTVIVKKNNQFVLSKKKNIRQR